MRDFPKSSGWRLRAGWFWPLVLLALPGCLLDAGAYDGTTTGFEGGEGARTSAIMCSIPIVPDPNASQCADEIEIGKRMRQAYGAIAFGQGESNQLTLDYSAAAIEQCNGPRKVDFYGTYPDGYAACLNCSQIGTTYTDAVDACFHVCLDLTKQGGNQFTPPEGYEEYCSAHAQVSINFNKDGCFDNVCSSGGSVLDFVDPRRDPELLQWTEQNGTSGGSSGNNLSRTAGRSGNFDAGGYSSQLIPRGDAWVEFEVNDNTKAYALGISSGDVDPSEQTDDIPFAILLKEDGHVYISENGTQLATDYGTYNAGDRFRVHVEEKNDASNTATLSAWRLNAKCIPDAKCDETMFATQSQSVANPTYPLRVDASLVDEAPAALVNVTLMRIIKQQ